MLRPVGVERAQLAQILDLLEAAVLVARCTDKVRANRMSGPFRGSNGVHSGTACKRVVFSGLERWHSRRHATNVKVVAITGASSGIGEATALLLAERGASPSSRLAWFARTSRRA
jgi:hypothetical protein